MPALLTWRQVPSYAVCLCFALALFFRTQVRSSFSLLLGDNLDGFIELSVLEHWFNTLRGLTSWSDTFYFYPYPNTLAYNDGYLLYGLAYSLFRGLRIDPLISSELVNILFRGIGFAAMQLFLRRCLRLALPWSLLGAVLFTTAFNMAMQAPHTQLLTVSLVPLFAVIVWQAITAFAAAAHGRSFAWSTLAAILMGAWLLTAYYMAWFTLFFLAWYGLFAALTAPRATLRQVRALPGAAWLSLVGTGAIFALAILPFLMLYLPQAKVTGMHSFAEALYYATNQLDPINIGDANLLLSPLNAWIQSSFRRGPDGGEHIAGITLFLLILFTLGCAHLWQARHEPSIRPIWLLALTSFFVWLLTVRFGAWAGWKWVFDWVPGAKGLRVTVRYQLFVTAPVIAIAVWYLARAGARTPRPLLAVISLVLIAEQVPLAQPVNLNRRAELDRLYSIPAPPPACRSFFVSRGRPVTASEINAIYSHNVDAMLLAEWFALPTINGFSTFTPPDWNFNGPDLPDYLARVRTYADAHKLAGLCALDLTAKRWNTDPFGA